MAACGTRHGGTRRTPAGSLVGRSQQASTDFGCWRRGLSESTDITANELAITSTEDLREIGRQGFHHKVALWDVSDPGSTARSLGPWPLRGLLSQAWHRVGESSNYTRRGHPRARLSPLTGRPHLDLRLGFRATHHSSDVFGGSDTGKLSGTNPRTKEFSKGFLQGLTLRQTSSPTSRKEGWM